MAQAKAYEQQTNSFIGGLITEATELTFPKNASYDELNCVLFPKGNRKRRLGIDFQDDYVLSSFTKTDTQLETFAINTYSWKGVAEQAALNFLVIQLGNTLYFYDFGTTPLSNGAKGFTLDLDTYLAPGQVDSSDVVAYFSAGRGDLFVVSSKIEPIKVTYDSGTDTISVEEITIKVRDFDGVDDGLDVDEETITLTDEHHYNLLNQGWYVTPESMDPLGVFFSEAATYPANNLQWTLSKKTAGGRKSTGSTSTWSNSEDGEPDTVRLRKLPVGTTRAPQGHFILDAFYKDRSAVSGVGGIDVESTDSRPSCVGFFSGRVVYVLNSNVYISQVLNQSRDNAGKCYQDADPTSEDISDLVQTDGLLITIPNANDIKAVAEVGTSLVLFATNGVWAISGTDGGFKATDFRVTKITSSGIVSNRGVVDVEGSPIWLSDTGIYSLASDPVSGNFQANSLTEVSIKTFYNDIDATSLANATGQYDRATGRVMWLYKDDDAAPASSSPYFYNRALLLDVNLKAFYPWTIEKLASDSPFICGIINTPSINLGDTTSDVVLSNGDNVQLDNGDEVITENSVAVGQSTFFQYLTMVPTVSASTNKITFSDFTNNTFTDWETYGIIVDSNVGGANYDSYLETGWDIKEDAMRFKQNPYITVHCERTETGVEYVDDEPVYTNPSGLFLRHKWDFSSGSQSGKWVTRQRAYRLRQLYIPETNDVDWDNGFRLTTTRLRIRGSGKAVQLRFESEDGKDFNIIGWGSLTTGGSEI